ncbi:hypothetical protein Fmac_012994 [Flemingia macrophylla]|uniref:Uncharacterized protein n=1 Tax=Flemingia macrophylla TaxID=520843 RepID=A0ABD1MRV5_9FABA
MWSVAPESSIQSWLKGVSETLSPKENGNLPEYAKEHVPVGFSSLLRKDPTLSISSELSWTDSPLFSSPVPAAICACPPLFEKPPFCPHS